MYITCVQGVAAGDVIELKPIMFMGARRMNRDTSKPGGPLVTDAATVITHVGKKERNLSEMLPTPFVNYNDVANINWKKFRSCW